MNISMLERKRRSNNDENNIKSKKRKVRTNCFSKENITCIEDLSNELFYDIFELLDFYHVYRVFYSLNIRFRQLITNSTLPIHLNLSSQSKRSLYYYYKDIILPENHRIELLHLSNSCLFDHFISLTDNLSKFLNLKILSFNNIEFQQFQSIIFILKSLKYLSSLSLNTIYGNSDINFICSHIFQLSTLKYFKISNINISYNESLLISMNQYSSIEYFIINCNIPVELLMLLLRYLPQLRRLYIQYISFSSNNQFQISSIKLNNLIHVSVGLVGTSFDQFEQMAIDIFSQVQVLYITITNDSNNVFINAKKWEELISSHLRYLRIFDFQYNTLSRINNNNNNNNINQTIINKLTDEFSSLFWIKQKYYFVEQHQKTKYHLRTIFFSTNPYRRKNYTLFDIINENIQKTYLKSVEHIHIANKNLIQNCQYYFPNVITLTLEGSFSCTLDSIIIDLNRVIALSHLTKLILDSHYFSLAKLMKLLLFSPNIHTLIFNSLSLYELNIQTLSQNETFQIISRTNIITNITLKKVCSLDKLEILMDLFPRMERLQIFIYSKDSEIIVRYILKKTKEQSNSHLHSVCLKGASKIWTNRIKTLIDSEKLLDNYMLKFIDDALDLWW